MFTIETPPESSAEPTPVVRVALFNVTEVWNGRKCCFGCISIYQACYIIGLLELLLVTLLQIQCLAIFIDDGYAFYTDHFSGSGNRFLGFSTAFSTFSALVVVGLFVGLRVKYPALLFLHILWQVAVLAMLILAIFFVADTLMAKAAILRESGLVLIAFFSFLLFLDLWFTLILLVMFYNIVFKPDSLAQGSSVFDGSVTGSGKTDV